MRVLTIKRLLLSHKILITENRCSISEPWWFNLMNVFALHLIEHFIIIIIISTMLTCKREMIIEDFPGEILLYYLQIG